MSISQIGKKCDIPWTSGACFSPLSALQKSAHFPLMCEHEHDLQEMFWQVV